MFLKYITALKQSNNITDSTQAIYNIKELIQNEIVYN